MRKIFAIVPSLLALAACSDRLGGPADNPVRHTVTAEQASYAGGIAPSAQEVALAEIKAVHFSDGRLLKIYDLDPASGWTFELPVLGSGGNIYMIAVGAESPGHMQPEYELPETGADESAWIASAVEARGGQPGMICFGKAALPSVPGMPVSLKLERGVARFDMVVDVAGTAEVRSMKFVNALQSMRLFADGTPENAVRGDIEIAFPAPLTAGTEGVAYLLAQDNPELEVEVSAVIDGKETVLNAALPEKLERNTVYRIVLRKDHVDADIDLSVTEWNGGGSVDADAGRGDAIVIDAGRSSLPAGAVIADGGRTLVLPHLASDFVLAFDSPDELELLPFEGKLLEVTAIEADARGIADFGKLNRFRVHKGLYAPNAAQQEIVLKFKRRSLEHAYDDDAIKLRLLANPVTLEGGMSFDNALYAHDFGKYVDNEFGVFNVPEGKEIVVEFPDGEDPWIRLDKGAGTCRVVGGWRPNDVTADGRVQKAVVVVRNSSDGSDREEYTIVRRNYGLPVTWMHGVWWCKYNARGNSRSFEDQVLSSADPAASRGMTLFEYLGSCSPEEFADLWGWAYQGSSGEGLRVVESNGKAVLDGFSTSVPDHINKIPADALSPDGYELASMDDYNRIFDATDYVWMMWNGTHHIKEPWNGHSAVKREQKRRNDVPVGSMTLSDVIYIQMYSPDFPEHEPIVWYGTSAQWNADGIIHSGHYNNLLFAMHSPQTGQGWYMAGTMSNLYLTKNGAGTKDTRIVRFKKSDVEYIY